MSKAEIYTRLRLQGMGDREAATEAGFVGGVSSQHARDLYRMCEIVQGDVMGCRWLREAKERHERKLREHQERLRDINAKLRAFELLQS